MEEQLSGGKIANVSLPEIKTAIEQLSFEERAELAAWLHGWKDDEWDEQMKRDIASGKLDDVLHESRGIKSGRVRKCRDVENAAAFWHEFNRLPAHIQCLAREKFHLWLRDPFHPSMQFKPLVGNVRSVRIRDHYRAVAQKHGDLVVWFWIGTHEDYNNFIKQLR